VRINGGIGAECNLYAGIECFLDILAAHGSYVFHFGRVHGWQPDFYGIFTHPVS
jgi:hypothetical protein